MTDIFISSARSTEPQAQQVAEALKALGYRVWRDDELPAHRAYSEVIEERLAAAKAVVVIWSADAAKSQWVRSEANRAREDHKLVQLSIDGAKAPMPFDQVQCADMTGWTGDTAAPGWRKVVKSVAALAEAPPTAGAEPAATEPPSRAAIEASLAPPDRRHWRYAALVIAAVTLVGITLAGLALTERLRVRQSTDTRIALETLRAVSSDPSARVLAEDLTADIAGTLNEYAREATLTRASSSKDADLVLGGTLARRGGVWRVRTYLTDPRSNAILVAGQFERPISQEAQLRTQVAVALTNQVLIAIDPKSKQPGLVLDPISLNLYVKAVHATLPTSLIKDIDPLQLTEQVLARRPDFVEAHSFAALLLTARAHGAPPAEQGALRKRAREEAEWAIGRVPAASGGAFIALYNLARMEAPLALAKAEDILSQGELQAPKFPYAAMVRCDFLVEVGRAAEGLHHCERAVAVAPLASQALREQAAALAAAGKGDLARQVVDRAILYTPQFIGARRLRFELSAFSGSPDEARTLLHDPAAQFAYRVPEIQVLDAFLKARQTMTASDINRALEAFRSAAARGEAEPRHVVMAAAVLGRLDEAFAAAAAPGLVSVIPAGGAGYLFEPSTAPMRRDPRFWAIARKAGLVDYWRARNVLPDFCTDPALTFDCKTTFSASPTYSPASQAAN
jgi:TolB-like protein